MSAGLPQPSKADGVGQNVFRPHTGGTRPGLRKPQRQRKRLAKPRASGNSSWWASLAFPFRTETLLSVGIMTVLLTLLFAPLEFTMFSPIMLAPRFLGGLVIVMLFVQAYFWHFLFQVLRTAAYNAPDLPLSADWDVENMVFDLRTAIGCAAMSFLPLAAFAVMRYGYILSEHPILAAAGVVLVVLCLPLAMLKAMTLLPMLVPLVPEIAPQVGGIAVVLILAGGLYWPMALVAGVLHESLRAALPWHVIPAILRIPGAYAQTLLLIVLVGVLGGVLQFLAGRIPILGSFLTWFVLLSGLTAIMHRLGAMYHIKRHTLRWFPDAPQSSEARLSHLGDLTIVTISPRARALAVSNGLRAWLVPLDSCETGGAGRREVEGLERDERSIQIILEHIRSRLVTENVVIIGSGPAGWSAAIYTSRAKLEPLLFEGNATQENWDLGRPPLGQLAITTEVENYPGFPAGDLSGYLDSAIDENKRKYMAPHLGHGVSGPELMELMRQQAVNFGTRVRTEDITAADFSARPFKLTTAGGEKVTAHAVIVATGARANYLGLPSESRFKNKGVSACAVCDGALPRFRDRPLVVVGGGDSAMEESDYLSKFGSKIYIVHRRDELRASKIMADRVLNNPKIEVKWSFVIDEILGNDEEGVTGVRIRSTKDESHTEELEVAGYFAAIGHTPNTDFLAGQLALTEKGYIRWTVPFRTNTSVEGVFAAGDVADDYYRQAVTAAGSGCMAALDAERWLAAQGRH